MILEEAFQWLLSALAAGVVVGLIAKLTEIKGRG